MPSKVRRPGKEVARYSTLLGIWLSSALSVISFGYLLTTAVAITKQYDGLPFWDSWDGYFGSIIKIDDGDVLAWWVQHNEHRIVLARMLFWLDFHFFGGNEAFLLVVIFLVVLLIAAILVVALTHVLSQEYGTLAPISAVITYSSLIVAFSTSWMQNENLAWGFQTQFVLVVALPLAAFVLLGYASWLRNLGQTRKAIWSLTFSGLAATGGALSMSAGLATPWLALLALVLLRFPRRTIGVWALGSTFLTIAYLFDYSSPAHPGQVSTLHTLLNQPIQVGVYFLRFIGSPAAHISGSTWLGTLAGLVVLVVALWLFISTFRRRRTSPSAFMLSVFALYILAFGLLTAAGRVPLGIETAFSSRYATPAIALWLSIGLLVWVKLRQVFLRYQIRVILVAAVILIMPASLQGGGLLADTEKTKANQNLAAIALSLNLADPAAIQYLYPDPERAVAIASQLRDLKVTPLGRPPFSSLASGLEKPSPSAPRLSCQASIFLNEPSVGDEFNRIAGTIHAAVPWATSPAFFVVDSEDKVVGYVSVGTSETFLGGENAASSPETRTFSGYVLKSEVSMVRLSGANWGCLQPIDLQPK